MQCITVIEMVSIGTSMHTATSHTYFWPMWLMPGVWSYPNMTLSQVRSATVGSDVDGTFSTEGTENQMRQRYL